MDVIKKGDILGVKTDIKCHNQKLSKGSVIKIIETYQINEKTFGYKFEDIETGNCDIFTSFCGYSFVSVNQDFAQKMSDTEIIEDIKLVMQINQASYNRKFYLIMDWAFLILAFLIPLAFNGMYENISQILKTFLLIISLICSGVSIINIKKEVSAQKKLDKLIEKVSQNIIKKLNDE